MTASQVGDDRSRLRCPTCGIGVITDLTHDAAPDGEPAQGPESRQTVTYSCGHVVVGASLATADPDALDVERRQSDETVDPSPAEPGTEPS